MGSPESIRPAEVLESEIAPTSADRLEIRGRPLGPPMMHQRWEKLLFLHWPVDPGLLRRSIPPPLSLDTFEGQAWIGITPFRLTGLRPAGLPPVPGVSSFYELNVRTYLHYDGFPGVWFFSLYASRRLPVLGARVLFSLPYRKAQMHSTRSGRRMSYDAQTSGEHAASFAATWKVGHPLPDPPLNSLEFFLVERYCLYAVDEERLFRCRIHHAPWAIHSAELTSLHSDLLLANGLPEPPGPPLVHFGGDQIVEVWPLEQVWPEPRD